MTLDQIKALEASAPWAVLIWPDWYDDDEDTGYYWTGEASSEAQAVAEACVACDRDNGRRDIDGELLDGYEATEPETVKVVECGKDWRTLYDRLKAAVLAP